MKTEDQISGGLGLAPGFDPSVTFPADEFGSDGAYIYGRTCHPTGDTCARVLAEMEGAECCLLTNSGMAAISAVLLAFLKSGDHIIAPQTMYQPTRFLLGKLLAPLGVSTSLVDSTDVGSYAAELRPNTRLAWIESPANPTLTLTDFAAMARWARNNGVLTVADNTFSTSIASKPISKGIDVVVHSATKYLAGHGDLLAGAILTSQSLKQQIFPWLDHLGSGLDAHGAWLLRRGLSTFPVRFERHQSNAAHIAEWLVTQPSVAAVYYPALISNSQRDLYLKQMKGGGGVLSFKIGWDAESAQRFMTKLKLCATARSLGEPRTLVAHPWSMHYKHLTCEEKKEAGIPETLIRLAAGLEDHEDICADLYQGLRTYNRRRD